MNMKITWLGHAYFLVEDARGIRVLNDPFDVDPAVFAGRGLKFAYPPITGVKADMAMVSHAHTRRQLPAAARPSLCFFSFTICLAQCDSRKVYVDMTRN